MATEAALLEAFEVHSPWAVRHALHDGVSPTALIKGKRPIDCLIEAYLRSSRFPDCLRVMIEAGASMGDPLLEALLLDDDAVLLGLLASSPDVKHCKLNLLTAFTSCRGVSALHVCAEFNSLRCARVLIEAGADVNHRADVDSEGLGGHTPIFHTVNMIFDYCRPMMELLVEGGADLDLRVNAILWGESFPWETVVFDVAPISYAQCGLYRQFHRREEHVYATIEYLYRARFGAPPTRRNVPNKYLVS